MSLRLMRVLEALAADPAARVSEVEILVAGERRQILAAGDDTATPAGVHELFQAQAARVPDAAALACGAAVQTYAGLQGRAARLARYLIQAGARAETVVGLCLDRADMVAGILAVWLAGAAYLPLDREYPAERLAFMLADSQVTLVLGSAAALEDLPAGRIQVIALDDPHTAAVVAAMPPVPPQAPVLLDQLAYVIYTSGSTGVPKGVQITHRGLLNYVTSVPGRIGLGEPGGRYGLLQGPATDLGNTVMFASLGTGGVLHVLEPELVTDPGAVARYLAGRGIDYLKVVPSHLAALGHRGGLASLVPARALVLGGEAATPELLHELLDVAGDRLVANHYGPTESTIGVATARLTQAALGSGRVPIGSPVPNTRLYVLDAHLNPVPAGVPGELFVGGAQVARGYGKRPALTAERFVADPFAGDGSRLYRTGDRARWRADGQLELLGRLDDQVKIRGFRIELGEVEAVLAGGPGVAQAAVAIREDTAGDKRMIGYVVPDTDAGGIAGDGLPAAVRAFAASRLPDHMVPAAVVVLAALPLTGNGKLDRKALPAPDFTAAPGGQGPATVREEILCAAFAEALGLPAVGPDDDFFELGGHSLLAVSLVERLRERGVRVAVRALFEAPTPAGLAAAAGRGAAEVPPNLIPAGAQEITPGMLPLVDLTAEQVARVVAGVDGGAANVADMYPLAPLQEGMFFHHLLAGEGPDVYLESFVLRFESRGRLEEFARALGQVVGRHDILRTSVAWEGLPEPVQVVWREAVLPVTEVSLPAGADAVAGLLAAAGPRMDLSTAPLLRLVAAEDPGGQGWLGLFQRHHLVLDHIGLEVVQREIAAVLAGNAGRLPTPLPFRDFVAQARLGVPAGEHQRYFAGLLGDVTEPTLPFGLADARGDGSGVRRARLVVQAELAGAVREVARGLGTSPATVWHLAWARVLAVVAGREDVVFGTVLLGRMDAGAGADRVPGPFMNTLPVRVRTGAYTVAAAVAAMRSQLAGLLAHEHAPLALAQQASGVPAYAPLFTALFNYRHSTRREDRPHTPGITQVHSHDTTNYPLAVAVNDTGDGFFITADAVAPVSPEQVCALVHTALASLTAALDQDPATPLRQVQVLNETERVQVLQQWNDTAAPVPAGTLPELFEEQVARTPDAVAVGCDGTWISYAELNGRANRLARLLVARGAGPEQVVAVMAERSVGLIIALLGVLKAGAAYLPVDPGYPAQRISYMLADARPAVIVVTADGAAGVPPVEAPVIVAAPDAVTASDLSDADRSARLLLTHPAYVIYTSGSTGMPKGVMVSHTGFASLAAGHARYIGAGASHRVAQFASASFDTFGWEWCMALLSGAALMIVPERRRLGAELTGFLAEAGITPRDAAPRGAGDPGRTIGQPRDSGDNGGRGLPGRGHGPVVGEPGDVQFIRPDRDHGGRDAVAVRQRCGPGADRLAGGQHAGVRAGRVAGPGAARGWPGSCTWPGRGWRGGTWAGRG